ncbi:tripartite tricarboxylate transporter TctB family protein [Acidaminococcus intestini]|uniref:Tripartite tricarboxylate transporter TctB family protein n=1 Tax=Acidaminococcus intestini TaxID=187327 RepID=A0A943EI62_9FIRM|nr:tripartite tricarboxylate transporter TctB family protein [Acidaminococcus intestini]MBS5520486.1 tripartite tricarboxylate transporter TctB family protein [Acidaminococcus intestini]
MDVRRNNIIISIIFILIGGFLYYEASFIKILMDKDLGSGFFPKVIGISMVIMALLNFCITLLDKRQKKQENRSQDDWKSFILTILCMIIYVAIFDSLGFILSTILYLFSQIIVLSKKENRNLPLFAGIAVLTAFAVYGIFVYLIGMPLPMGILEF